MKQSLLSQASIFTSQQCASEKHGTVPIDEIGRLTTWVVEAPGGTRLVVDRFAPEPHPHHSIAHHTLKHSELLFMHANGFSRYCFRPMFADLRKLGLRNPIVAFDIIGHGDSTTQLRDWDWTLMGEHANAVINSVKSIYGRDGKTAQSFIGVGHSLGGASLVMTEASHPKTFKGLILIEPIIFNPEAVKDSDFTTALVEMAMRRKTQFPSFEAAKQYFASKSVFKRWDERALNEYIYNSMRQLENGTVELKCSKETEAKFFSNSIHFTWSKLPSIKCPTLILAGSETTFVPLELMNMQANEMPNAKTTVLNDVGHLVPMENPEALAEVTLKFLGDLDEAVHHPKSSKL